MGVISWLTSCFSRRASALSTYRAGVAKANNKDYRGAIAEYSTVIKTPNLAADVWAMAVYNRALAYAATGDEEKADDDLAAMLKAPGLPENIIKQARQRRERIRRRVEKREPEA